LNDNFEQVFMLVGNHDLYYRESREVHGLRFTELYPNITLIEKPVQLGDVMLIPWLVKDEWKEFEGITSKYVFGHLELPTFKLNQMIEMPDHGQLNSKHFSKTEYVFSGHFHKRQVQGNIHYIGNPFPHNYSDAWDDDRGAMLLEYDGEPRYINWEGMPKYRTISLDDLLVDPSSILEDNMHVRVSMDSAISHEDLNYIKETLAHSFNLRELHITSSASREGLDGGSLVNNDLVFESIDQIVTKQLLNIQSKAYDQDILVAIYNSV
jgi:DNA repair exonuclease SbcCD nuclease subunit